MRHAGKALEGTHDFSTLKGANTTPVDPVKTIYAVGIVEKNGHIDFCRWRWFFISYGSEYSWVIS